MLFYHAGGNWYSVRLYRSPSHQGVMSAVFCICLYDRIYIKVKIIVMLLFHNPCLPVQHCDSIMKEKFSGELSWEFAHDVQDCIEVYSDDKYVLFDKTPAQVST